MQPLLAKPSDYRDVCLSPERNRLALISGEDVWIYDWRRETMSRLTFDGGNRSPLWTPDGKYVVFSGPSGLFWTRSDGAAKPQPLTQSQYFQRLTSFTADGKRMAFDEGAPDGNRHLWTATIESNATGLHAGDAEQYLRTSTSEAMASFSPDGQWLAYTSDESGNFEVYVRAFPDRGGKWQISNAGGREPQWSQNGRELFFCNRENQIMVAGYTVKRDSFVPEKPRIWSQKTLANVALRYHYDLSPDGEAVAALLPDESPEAQKAENHVIFLLNFFDELRRRVPVEGR
jgi:serine/threonine-protein kinase